MFETVIHRDELLDPVSLVVGVTERKNLMPYLSNVLLHFGQESYTYATDLQISAVAKINHKTEEELTLLLNGKKLHDTLREMERAEISVSLARSFLILKQGNIQFELTLYNPSDFPEIKGLNPESTFQIGGEELLQILGSVSFAMGVDETRYVLCGTFFHLQPEKLTLVATDGFRMAIRRVPLREIQPIPGVIVPSRAIRELEKNVRENESVLVEIEKSAISFTTERVKIVSRTIEGKYPDYDGATPKHYKLKATFEKVAFQRALKRVSALMGRNDPVLIRFSKDAVEISAKSQEGNAKEVISARFDGQTKNLHFNVRFLIDAVSHARGDLITMELPEEFGPVVLEDSSEKDYVNVIMPVKL